MNNHKEAKLLEISIALSEEGQVFIDTYEVEKEKLEAALKEWPHLKPLLFLLRRAKELTKDLVESLTQMIKAP